MSASFGLFERLPGGMKVRIGADRGLAFETIKAGLAHFGDRVVDSEISDDGSACDFFVNIGVTGAVYAIERL